MLIAALEMAVAAEATLDHDARSERAPVLVSDAQLYFWGEFYRANPALRIRGISFEAFLSYQVRNGALFEKLRHHRHHRHGRSALRMEER